MSFFPLLAIGLKTAIDVGNIAKAQANGQGPKRKKVACTPCAAYARVEKAKKFGQKK